MPYDRPAPVDHRVDHILARLIDLVDIQIKIVIDDITCGSNKNRSDNKPGDLKNIVRPEDLLVNAEIKKYLRNNNKYKIRPADKTEKGCN